MREAVRFPNLRLAHPPIDPLGLTTPLLCILFLSEVLLRCLTKEPFNEEIQQQIGFRTLRIVMHFHTDSQNLVAGQF